jgi:hypothetical protein
MLEADGIPCGFCAEYVMYRRCIGCSKVLWSDPEDRVSKRCNERFCVECSAKEDTTDGLCRSCVLIQANSDKK